MREVKFRAWLDYGDGTGEMLPNIQNHINDKWAFGHIVNGSVKNVSEPMQYTGFKNYDGVEVFEGDILTDIESELEYSLAKVHYDDSQGKYVLLDWRGEYTGDLEEWYECPIVGNIHENPELLK